MEITKYNDPFDHLVIDNFMSEEAALKIAKEFPDYHDEIWNQKGYVYNNVLERKKTLRDWGSFKPNTYQFFLHLCSSYFIERLQNTFKKPNEILPLTVYPDYGLHGAGLHIHKTGEHLNIHLDYSIHPYLNLQRKFNFIVYLTPNWNPDWGGGLEFWSHDSESNQPKEKIKTIQNIFRRAVIFDTTQNSWHGVSEKIKCPENVYRQSIAMYYLTKYESDVDQRKRALFAPLESQKNNDEIKKFILERVKC